MRMTLSPEEHTLVAQARQLEKLQAKRAKLAQELATLDEGIALVSEAVRRLLPGTEAKEAKAPKEPQAPEPPIMERLLADVRR